MTQAIQEMTHRNADFDVIIESKSAGPSTGVFGGVAIGVANAMEAAMQRPSCAGFGSHPMFCRDGDTDPVQPVLRMRYST